MRQVYEVKAALYNNSFIKISRLQSRLDYRTTTKSCKENAAQLSLSRSYRSPLCNVCVFFFFANNEIKPHARRRAQSRLTMFLSEVYTV